MRYGAVLLLVLCVGSVAAQSPEERLRTVEETPQYPLDLNYLGVKVPRFVEPMEIERRMLDRETVYYKLPPVWQHYVPPVELTVSSGDLQMQGKQRVKPKWGFYYVTHKPELNANLDFPWEGTIGLQDAIRSKNEKVGTINFLSLPRDHRGELVPVRLMYEVPAHYIFPVGTVVGELIMTSYKNRWWIQEIRTREKLADSFHWQPKVYRPVLNRQELVRLVFQGHDYTPAKRFFMFRNPEEDEVMRLEGFVELLPTLTEQQVEKLLSLPFKDVTDVPWSEVSMAPTTTQDFSLVPKLYSFGLLSPDQDNCMNCHKQTGISVRHLIPREPAIQEAYEDVGNIRGADSVFTWYPWGPSMIQGDIRKDGEITWSLREHDLKHGILKVYRPRTDRELDPEVYQLTEFVQASLPKYMLPRHTSLLHDPGVSEPQKQLTKRE